MTNLKEKLLLNEDFEDEEEEEEEKSLPRKEGIFIEGRRSGYGPDQVERNTMTVDELIEKLNEYPGDIKVFLTNDNGYTYGEINEYSIHRGDYNDDGDVDLFESLNEDLSEEEQKQSALASLCNDAIANEWADIDRYNSYKSTFEFEKPECTDAIKILETIINEKTIHVGMLQKLADLCSSSEKTELIQTGVEKAEDVTSTDTKEKELSDEEKSSEEEHKEEN